VLITLNDGYEQFPAHEHSKSNHLNDPRPGRQINVTQMMLQTAIFVLAFRKSF
jgi:hypothetical protein